MFEGVEWTSILQNEPSLYAATLTLVSFVIFVIASNLAWRVRISRDSQYSQRILKAGQNQLVRVSYELARLIYYLGFPFLALSLGWIDVRAFGLSNLDWADGIRWAIVITLAAWSLLMFIWVPYLRATADVPAPADARKLTPPRRIVEVIYMQAHWAFYRVAGIMLFMSAMTDERAFYWGTSIGLGLIFVEAWADPRVRRKLLTVGEADRTLWNVGKAIVNAVGFVVTRNIWLLLLIDLAIEFTVPHMRALPPPTVARLAAERTRRESAKMRGESR